MPSKAKPILPGSSIKAYRLRGEYKANLEKVIEDADVYYTLRSARDALQRITGGDLTAIQDYVLIMHQTMFCASASEMSSEYGYRAVVAMETLVTETINEPIGKSLQEATPEYLLLRAIENMTVVLRTIKKIQVWPADAQTQLVVAATALCLFIDGCRRKLAEFNATSYRENFLEAMADARTVMKSATTPEGVVEVVEDLVKKVENLGEAKAEVAKYATGGMVYFDTETQGLNGGGKTTVTKMDEDIQQLMATVNAQYPTASCIMSDKGDRYRIEILPKGKPISAWKKTMRAAWQNAIELAKSDTELMQFPSITAEG